MISSFSCYAGWFKRKRTTRGGRGDAAVRDVLAVEENADYGRYAHECLFLFPRQQQCRLQTSQLSCTCRVQPSRTRRNAERAAAKIIICSGADTLTLARATSRHRMPVSVLLTRTAPSRLSSSARRAHAALRGKLKPPRPHLFRVRASAMEKVTFGDAAVPGYECGEKTAPGVIVLQEWWGVTENIKKQALFISSKVTGRPTTRCRLLPPPQCLRDSYRFFVSSIHHSGSTALPSNGVSFRAQQQQHVNCSHSTLK